MIDVTTRRVGRKRRAGLRIHRSGTLTAAQITTHRGVPITTPTRTIIDLARTVEGRALEALIDRARPARPRRLRRPRNRQLRLPTGGVDELRVEGFEVDFVWREQGLIVEVDGYRYHRSPAAFEDDRERDVVLTTRGWRVLRFTWRQITGRAAWVAAAVTGGGGISSRHGHSHPVL